MNKILTKTQFSLLVIVLILCAGPVLAHEDMAVELPLFARLGGLAPISVVVSDLLDVVIPDPILNKNPAIAASRDRVPAAYLKFQVTSMVCQAAGGPCEYSGSNMKSSHAHLNITEVEWQQFIKLFKSVLAKHKVPQTETDELLAIVESTKADIVAP